MADTPTPTMLVRTDADPQTGIGHIMRCLALAQAWQAEGGEVCFLSHLEIASLRRTLEAEGFSVLALEAEQGSEADLQKTLVVVDRLNADWVVVDGYRFDVNYHQMLSNSGVRTIMVDSVARLDRYDCNLLLNYRPTATQGMYAVCRPETQLLLGPRYFLLRQEFTGVPQADRSFPDRAEKILITTGGGDYAAVVPELLRILLQLAGEEIEIRVILGEICASGTQIRAMARQSPHAIRCLSHGEVSMPELAAWADVAISAAGVTCWELAFMGVPTLCFSVAENQLSTAQFMREERLMIDLGWHKSISSACWEKELKRILGDPALRRQMSEACRQVVDGQGARRAVEAMRGYRESTQYEAESPFKG